jgi:hypothetical protein
MAFAHAREINLTIVVADGEGVSLVGDHLRSVIVQIEHNRAIEQARDAPGIDPGLGSRPTAKQCKQDYRPDYVAHRVSRIQTD